MSIRRRTLLLGLLAVGLVTVVLLFPAFPWSGRWQHTLDRIVVRAEMNLARLRGKAPRLAAMTGTVNIPGAAVEALDSRSGLACLADATGAFTLPGIKWYSGAGYDLIVSTDDQQGLSLRVRAPEDMPSEGEFSVGALDAHAGRPVKLAHLPGLNSITYERYDWPNNQYYRDAFDWLTATETSDESKINAINSYVATRLSYAETQWEIGSPRRVLENGSQFCGHLAEAMATLLVAGNYEARTVNICDTGSKPNTHVVVEVFYKGGWHLYDPTFGAKFQDAAGSVASYRDLRFDQSLIPRNFFNADFRRPLPALPEWMPGAYRSGYHHFYLIQK